MTSKAPKKKDSRERVPSAAQKFQEPPSAIPPIYEKDDKGRKGGGRVSIPVWPEWSDQDIAAEKWDTGHRARMDQKSRGPGTSVHFFEEPEGRIELPQSLKDKVYSWRRFQDAVPDGKVPVMVDQECLKGKEFDLLSSSNEAVTDSELMRWIIAAITTLSKTNRQVDAESSFLLLKTKPSKDQKDIKESKMEKMKKESDIFADDMIAWKPWHHIWPKEQIGRFPLAPAYNPGGKYCVKIFWMGSWRKVTVDDFVPCDEKDNILLPTSTRDSEFWPLLLSKALVKVASLDYNGGNSFSEMGDGNIIHCLTGWLPEPIPLRYGHTSEIWKLLLKILPNWKLDKPEAKIKLTEKESKQVADEEVKKEENLKPDVKETREGKESKMKKEEKEVKETGNKEKGDRGKTDKQKEREKAEKDGKNKEKVRLSSGTQARLNTEPEFVIFASYSPPPRTPLKISTLREMADASERLRQFGLSHNHPHPVHVTMVRNCPLVPPPTPVPIPRWKLIRKKKKTHIVEPPFHKEPPKPPMFVELSSPFINYNISPVPVSRVPTPAKWKKYKPETPMDSLTEEEKELTVENDSGMGTDEGAKEGGQESNSVKKENDAENAKKAAEQQATNAMKPKGGALTEINVQLVNEKERSFEREATKTGATKSRKERPFSGKSTLFEAEPGEKKIGRKVSTTSNRIDSGSAKGKKVLNHPKIILEKEGKDTKEVKGKVKEREIPETVPEVEITKPDADAGGEYVEIDGEKVDESGKDGEKSINALWMEYDEFCLCFRTLWIFHKSTTYSFYKGISELKNADQKVDKGKKPILNPAVSNVAPTPSGRNPTVASPSAYGSHQSFSDVPMLYLFVDSLSKIELLISFSSFSRWFEPLNQTVPAVKEKEKEATEIEEKSVKESSPAPLPSGTLIAEPYSWKSLVTGLPSLRIKTTGIKSALLALPPGRHVMRFMIQAPIGYHVDICSQTSFVFGEEDVVLQNVTKESIRFTEHAVNTLLGITDMITLFAEPPPANRSLRPFLLGSENESIITYSQHFQALFSSFAQAAKSELGSEFKDETVFSIEALKYEVALCMKKHLQTIKTKDDDRLQEYVLEDEANADEHGDQEKRRIAATKIQAWFRGTSLRLLIKAREPGSKENKIVTENLKKITAAIDGNSDNFAVHMYREMFRGWPELYKIFPFYKDEWTRIAFADYNGSYPEQPTNSWFILFREIFFAQESVLVVPKLYINIPSCILRVIDNDSGEQMPMVFMRVIPRVLQKNKNGYTFVAEASSGNAALTPGKFRMRLIGSTDPLPSPVKEGFVNTSFTTKEIRDYYVPNRNNTIFRYTAKVVEDHQVSIQVSTSKPDVYIRLEVLDHEAVVATAHGRGHVVLPAFMFLRDHSDDEDEKASRKSSRLSSGRSSFKGHKGQKGATLKRAVSPFDKSSKKVSKPIQSPNQSFVIDSADKVSSNKIKTSDSTETLDQSNEEQDQIQNHKYIVQAVVVRDSWPLTKNQWNFISTLKQMEKTEGEALETSTKTEKHSAGQKGKKGSKESKDGKSGKTHQQAANSRPSSQQFDTTKPNWIFRVVCDASGGEIEIKRDTERQDEIKAMKAAWEAEEPGRAAKAQQTRMKFLNENTIKLSKDIKDGAQDENEKAPPESVPSSVSPSLTLDNEPTELMLSPPAKDQEIILKPFDLSPYIRSTGKSTLLDEKVEERLRLEMIEKIRKYKEFRENVLEAREADRIARNLEKEKQLQEYEDMQAKLDENRQAIHILREQYRQKFIDQPPVDNTSEVSKKRKTPSPGRGRKTPRSKSPKEKSKTKTPSKGKKK